MDDPVATALLMGGTFFAGAVFGAILVTFWRDPA